MNWTHYDLWHYGLDRMLGYGGIFPPAWWYASFPAKDIDE